MKFVECGKIGTDTAEIEYERESKYILEKEIVNLKNTICDIKNTKRNKNRVHSVENNKQNITKYGAVGYNAYKFKNKQFSAILKENNTNKFTSNQTLKNEINGDIVIENH